MVLPGYSILKYYQCLKNYQLNFNPTPIPKFFGGAHYTWQILNKNLDSGLFIQEITKNVDRGEIIYIKKMKIKKTYKT